MARSLNNKLWFVKHSVTLLPATLAPPSNCRRSQRNYTTVSVGIGVCESMSFRGDWSGLTLQIAGKDTCRVTASWIEKTGACEVVSSRIPQ